MAVKDICFMGNLHNLSYCMALEMRRRGYDARLLYDRTDDASSVPPLGVPWCHCAYDARARSAAFGPYAVKRFISESRRRRRIRKYTARRAVVVSDGNGYDMATNRSKLSGLYYALVHGEEMREAAFRMNYHGVKWRCFLEGAEAVLHFQVDLPKYAARLGLKRVEYLPVPIDAEYWLPEEAAPARFNVLAPSMNAWDSKGNDSALRGFAAFAEGRPDARLTVLGDGTDFGRTLSLAEQLGVRDRLICVPYVDRATLRTMMASAGAVLDSFVLGTLAMVGLEAMSMRRPVICHVNEAEYMEAHGAVPPIHNARTPAQICAALESVADGPGDEPAGRVWVKAHHRPSLAARVLDHVLRQA